MAVGEIRGTIHRRVMDIFSPEDLLPGSVLVLRHVSYHNNLPLLSQQQQQLQTSNIAFRLLCLPQPQGGSISISLPITSHMYSLLRVTRLKSSLRCDQTEEIPSGKSCTLNRHLRTHLLHRSLASNSIRPGLTLTRKTRQIPVVWLYTRA